MRPRSRLAWLVAAALALMACGGSETALREGAAEPTEAQGSGDRDAQGNEGSGDAASDSTATDGEDDSNVTGSTGTARLRLDTGESYEFGVLCALEPQRAAGADILFTLVSYDDPLNLDVTQFGADSFGGAANISVYDSTSYEVVWEASSLTGTDVSLSIDEATVTGRGVFFPGGDSDAPGVEGELEATC